MPANGQFFVGAEMAVSLQQTTQKVSFKQDVPSTDYDSWWIFMGLSQSSMCTKM